MKRLGHPRLCCYLVVISRNKGTKQKGKNFKTKRSHATGRGSLGTSNSLFRVLPAKTLPPPPPSTPRLVRLMTSGQLINRGLVCGSSSLFNRNQRDESLPFVSDSYCSATKRFVRLATMNSIHLVSFCLFQNTGSNQKFR